MAFSVGNPCTETVIDIRNGDILLKRFVAPDVVSMRDVAGLCCNDTLQAYPKHDLRLGFA